MFDVVLFEPEIPQNTGNIIRLCANTGARLHLVAPLGFRLHDRRLKRAGLDYHHLASVTSHRDWATCRDFFAGRQMFALTTRGARRYDTPAFAAGDVFLFGPESRGLPNEVLDAFPEEVSLHIPMLTEDRSLNLANAVAVVLFEAWRQSGFAHA
jgi:tRNA (cytidine/uridine-2'-O-)-methyltransferase